MLLDVAILVAALGWAVLAIGLARLSWSVSNVFRQQIHALRVTERREHAADEMPQSLQAWINAESEPFAREELTQQALALREELGGNWHHTEELMRELHARDTSTPEAAVGAAWDRAGAHLAGLAAAADPWSYRKPEPLDDDDDDMVNN